MQSMTRGTTPVFQFTLPFDTVTMAAMWLTFQQGNTSLTKGLSDATASGNVISVALTQEETLLFCSQKRAQLQMRVLFEDGSAAASQVVILDIERILKGGVIRAGTSAVSS